MARRNQRPGGAAFHLSEFDAVREILLMLGKGLVAGFMIAAPLGPVGVLCVQRHRLDPGQCLYVGAGPQDPGFARRCGFQYVDAGEFLTSGFVLRFL